MTNVFQPAQVQLAREYLPSDKLAHSIRVGELASRQGAAYATVGLFHDMLEDTGVSMGELRASGATIEELTAVQLLTRGSETYDEYVMTVAESGNRLAISVKLCDLLDHLDPAINASLTEPKKDRYLRALPLLITALNSLNASEIAPST